MLFLNSLIEPVDGEPDDCHCRRLLLSFSITTLIAFGRYRTVSHTFGRILLVLGTGMINVRALFRLASVGILQAIGKTPE